MCIRDSNIPDILPDSARKKLVEKLNKGKMYYKEYCAECHGIFTKGKENVPNFTNEQINNYSGRMKRRDPKIHGSVLKMSDEQMEEVITFLQLRKHDEKNSKKRIKKQY